MCLLGTDAREILLILILQEEVLHFIEYRDVFLLEDLRPVPLAYLASSFVDAVLIYGIDEEEAQHLDVLVEELLLTLEVLLDRGADLDTADGLLGDGTDSLPLVDLLTTAQTDAALDAIDTLDREAVTVSLYLATLGVEIKALIYETCRRAQAHSTCGIEADACSGGFAFLLRQDDCL